MIESILPADVLAVQIFAHRLDFPLSRRRRRSSPGPAPSAVPSSPVCGPAPTTRSPRSVCRPRRCSPTSGAPRTGRLASSAAWPTAPDTAPRPWPSPTASAPSASTPSPTPRSRTEHWTSSPAPRSAPPSPGCPRPGPAGTASCSAPRSPSTRPGTPSPAAGSTSRRPASTSPRTAPSPPRPRPGAARTHLSARALGRRGRSRGHGARGGGGLTRNRRRHRTGRAHACCLSAACAPGGAGRTRRPPRPGVRPPGVRGRAPRDRGSACTRPCPL